MTVFRLATEATGLVQMIQQARISPSAMRRNMSMVPPPASVRMVPGGTPQMFSTKARSSSEITERWPGRPGPM